MSGTERAPSTHVSCSPEPGRRPRSGNHVWAVPLQASGCLLLAQPLSAGPQQGKQCGCLLVRCCQQALCHRLLSIGMDPHCCVAVVVAVVVRGGSWLRVAGLG